MISKKKFILDIFLIMLLIPLLYLGFTGGLIHEWLGIVFTVVVFVHLMFNFKWIKAITKNFDNVNQKVKTLYLLNIVVFISYFITIITGILISKYIFLFITVSTSLTLILHYIFGYISLVLTFAHLVLHYKEINNTLKNKIKSDYSRGISFGILAILSGVFAFIIYDKRYLLKIPKKEVSYKVQESSSKQQIKSSSSEPLDTPPSLYEYLSKLHCSGCGNRCLLTSLRCSRGEAYKQMAEADYNEKYNIVN